MTSILTRALLQQYRGLKQSKGRQATGWFLLEGQRLCRDVLDSLLEIEAAVVADSFDAFALPPDLSIYTATRVQGEQLADSRSPQDIFLIARIPKTRSLPKPSDVRKVLALDRIADPGNVGTLLRSARWFGIETVLLSPQCADPYNPKTVRSSMGAIGALDIHRHVDLIAYCEDWVTAGGKLVGLDMTGAAIQDHDFQMPMVLIVGSEAHGLDPKLASRAKCLKIPRAGSGESLNAAMAGTIALWEWSRKPSA